METTIIGCVCFMLAIACYAVVQTLQLRHDMSIWRSVRADSFFGIGSWYRKYDKKFLDRPAPSNWYYRRFGIRYKEKFPGSATVFVFLTDAMHFFQFMFFNLLCLSVNLIIFSGWSVVINFFLLRIIVWLVWGLFFEHLLVKRK